MSFELPKALKNKRLDLYEKIEKEWQVVIKDLEHSWRQSTGDPKGKIPEPIAMSYRSIYIKGALAGIVAPIEAVANKYTPAQIAKAIEAAGKRAAHELLELQDILKHLEEDKSRIITKGNLDLVQ